MSTSTNSVFVTVGTTSFDNLISAITLPEVLTFIKSHGFNKIVLQYGRGSRPSIIKNNVDVENGVCSNGLLYSAYRFKSSLEVRRILKILRIN